MEKRGENETQRRQSKSRLHRILLSFSTPKTPTQVEKDLGIKKLKLKGLVDKGLLEPLNPEAKKGRFYVLTEKGRRVVELSHPAGHTNKDWELMSWVMASPRQRLVVLRSLDSARRTSENIRMRSSRLNPHLTRISTKAVLNELFGRRLIDTQLIGQKRYYWINEKGKSLIKDLNLSLVNSNDEFLFLGLTLANYLLMQFWYLLAISFQFS